MTTKAQSCSRKVLNTRTSKDIDKDVMSIIREVTAKMSTLPVGTFKYKVFKYPGDIDIFEPLEGCCSFNDAKMSAAGSIQHIVRNVVKDPNVIFMDFKSGYDNRYRIYTGVIGEGIEDYNAELIRRDVANLYEAGLLYDDEYKWLSSLILDYPTIDSMTELNEALRKFWVVRWTSEEILDGYKVLRGNLKLYLDVALTHGSIVKLDTIAPISGPEARYLEVTNFFLVAQKDKFGNVITLSEELGDYEQSILGDVYKYRDTKVLKSVKRLWMYLAYLNQPCELNQFTPLFSSDIALFTQINADIEVAIDLLKSNKVYDRDFLLNSTCRRLSKLKGLCDAQDFARVASYGSDEDIVDYLNELHDCLLENINIMTNKWLEDHNIDIIALAKKYSTRDSESINYE